VNTVYKVALLSSRGTGGMDKIASRAGHFAWGEGRGLKDD